MPSSAPSIADCLWTSSAEEPVVPAPPLVGTTRVDAAVVGGGFAGCAAALALAEAGASVALLEAQDIGWGASGRNGGQVIPGLKLDPSELRARFGDAAGRALAEQAGGAADLVFGLVARHAIRCAPVRAGWIQAAHAPQALDRVLRRARDWDAEGAPVELLDAAALRDRTGTAGYCGGWRDKRAGTVQPLAYVRGLARAAAAAGAALHGGSPVRRLSCQPGGWLLEAEGGTVLAPAVLICTDAYSGALVPGLAQSMLLVQSVQVATGPMPAELRARVLPGGECVSETRRLAYYFRTSPDGRLVFGGRGAVGDAHSATMFASLLRAMHRTVPGSAGLPVEHRWSGQVGLTLDGLPRVLEPQPGLFVGMGYNGRGVAMATRMGGWLADRLHRGAATPLPASAMAPIPWHGARRPALAAGIALAWLRDRLGHAA